MEKCLITSLTASVNDPENKFEYFGYCNFLVRVSNMQTRLFRITCGNGGSDLKIIGDENAFFVNANNQSLGKEIHLDASAQGQIVRIRNNADSTKIIRLLIKGSVTAIDRYDNSQTNDLQFKNVDISTMLKYFVNIDTLSMYSINAEVSFDSSRDNLVNFKKFSLPFIKADNPNFHFNTSDFAEYTNLEQINLDAVTPNTTTDISGTINDFGQCIKLTNLNFYGRPNISGDLDTLASAMVSNQRTSGTLVVMGQNTGIRYNGNTFVTKTITFNSSLPNGYSIS